MNAQETQIIDGFKYYLNSIEKIATVMPNNYSQTEITIPSEVTDGNKQYTVIGIGKDAFKGCTNLTKITFPQTLTTIGNYAFGGCMNLQQIEFPENLTTLGDGAFDGSGITSVTIPSRIKTIPDAAFEDCPYLKNVTIEEGITEIGWYAFRDCNQLETISIPTTMETMGRMAFDGCTHLKAVKIASIASWCNITFYPDNYWATCNPLYYAHNLYLNNALVEHLIIPNNIKKIKKNAFYNCTCIKSIEFPSSLEEIEINAFDNVRNTSVYIHNLEKWCKVKFSGLANPINWGADLYLNGKLLTKLVIPNTISEIDYSSFRRCTSIKEIIIHENVKKIPSGAFSECNNLTTIKCYCINPPDTGYGSSAITDEVTTCMLFVPQKSLQTYKNNEVWGQFKYIYSLDNDKPEDSQQCEAPSITYLANKLTLQSNTKGAKYYCSINCADSQTDTFSENGIIPISGKYTIEAYASAQGYEQSNITTANLYWLNANLETDNINQAQTRGIVVSSDNGIISISGLDNNEKVSFYSTEGMVLGSQKAIDGRVNYAVGTAQKIIIVKIGDNSIKVMNP